MIFVLGISVKDPFGLIEVFQLEIAEYSVEFVLAFLRHGEDGDLQVFLHDKPNRGFHRR